MQKIGASAFGLCWPLWACLAALLGLPASARALTLPVIAADGVLSSSLRVGGLKDGPSVWRLLNPSSPLPDEDVDWPPACPASPSRAGGDAPPATDPGGSGGVPDSLPPPGRNDPDPASHWPDQGSQPSGSNGGGSSRPTGGDGPTQFGMTVTAANISLTAAGRLPSERMVLDLPEHASSVFRPPRP